MNTPDPFTPASYWVIEGEAVPCRLDRLTEDLWVWLPRMLNIHYSTVQGGWRLQWRGSDRFIMEIPDLTEGAIRKVIRQWYNNVARGERPKRLGKNEVMDTGCRGVAVTRLRTVSRPHPWVGIFISLPLEIDGKRVCKQLSRTGCSLKAYLNDPVKADKMFTSRLSHAVSYRKQYDYETHRGTLNLPTEPPSWDTHVVSDSAIELVSNIDTKGMLDFAFNDHLMV